MSHDTAPLDPYPLRLVVNRRGDAYTAHFVEPEGQESAASYLSTGSGRGGSEPRKVLHIART